MRKKIIGISLVISLLLMFVFLMFYNVDYKPNKEVNLPFKIDNSKEKLIIFFGYVGCPTICPTSLSIISQATKTIKDNKLQVVFIGLSDTSTFATNEFANKFNSNFIGLKLKKNEQRDLIENFNVFWSPEIKKIKREAAHSPYIYFLIKENNSWILKNVYTQYPPIKNDIVKLTNNL